MTQLDPVLRDKVKRLGQLLGQTIENQHGPNMLETIESIRQQAKLATTSDDVAERDELISRLKALSEQDLLPVVRGFNQFLNLANIADQQHSASWRRSEELKSLADDMLPDLLDRLQQREVAPAVLREEIADLNIELVLTAHPTEVTRRTLIQKYDLIARLLQQRDDLHPDHPQVETIDRKLASVVEEIWRTNEIRKQRPTAVDEARWGFAVVENSLWEAIPALLRDIDDELIKRGGERLPLDAAPIRFASWMGGDRDGNPNVTSLVTREVLYLSRWMAADMLLKDVDLIGQQLSMGEASAELKRAYPGEREPYRACMHSLRDRLRDTQKWASASIRGDADTGDLNPLRVEAEIVEPLMLCYRSLLEQGLDTIANGHLLDSLRRLACFGLTLVRLDVRQESSRHTEVMAEICDYYGMPGYADWSEEDKQAFLLKELQSRRPLIPRHWTPSDNVREVLDSMALLATDAGDGVTCYIISMASEPSDVLSVALLLQDSGVRQHFPVVPLFETLDDLQQSEARMRKLWAIDWYREHSQQAQQVMIGYSDSSKDAGQLAAVWAQYQTQERLIQLADEMDMRLTLFHGRGGSVGRGGGPAHRAILAQPPGSVRQGLRVTEQGEMIRFKFGLPSVAERNLRVYVASVLEANLIPPQPARDSWRETMHTLADTAVASYRSVVRDTPEFVRYFRTATPEQELGKLALGSRPARRKSDGGIESLRAIPWIFAWTQMRLMLPAWLGTDEALKSLIDAGEGQKLQEMYQEWPFFRTYIDMLEMVTSKADPAISRYYESRLVEQELQMLGSQLRLRLERVQKQVLVVNGQKQLLDAMPILRSSMLVRDPYTDPLHYLQAELLYRERQQPDLVSEEVEQALMVTMAGIAAGMRNTG